MSKFYYQGKIQQENFLTNKDQLLRGIYGKYQLMIIEAFTFLFFSVFTLLSYFLHLENYLGIPNLYPKVLGAVFIFLAVVFEITYRFILKKKNGQFLGPRIFLYFVLGLILIFFPAVQHGFIYSTMAMVFISVGAFYLFKKNKSGIQIVISIGLIALGCFFIFFPVQTNYKDIVFYVLIGVLGIYLLVNGYRFRSRLKPYEDEQKGFTDFKIEN